MKFQKVIILLVALTLLIPYSSFAASRVAIIKNIKGEVYILKSGGKREFKATNDMSLSQGDTVRTGKKSSATILYDNGSKSTVGASSKVTITKLSDKNGGKQSNVKVWSGELWNSVKSLTNTNDKYNVETPTAVMGVRGTLFLVETDPATGDVKVTVLDGEVGVGTNKESDYANDNDGTFKESVKLNEAISVKNNGVNTTVKTVDEKELVNTIDPEILVNVLIDLIETAQETHNEAKGAQAKYKGTNKNEDIKDAIKLSKQAAAIAQIQKNILITLNQSNKKSEVEQLLKDQGRESVLKIEEKTNELLNETKKTETDVIKDAKSAGLTDKEIKGLEPISTPSPLTNPVTTPSSGSGTSNSPNTDTIKPVITLNGSSTITIIKGHSYTEPGYTATDNKDGTITNKVVVIGTVNINVVGTYTLTYTVKDNAGNITTATRTVNIVESAPTDTIKPVIALKGNSEYYIALNSTFEEPGYSAIDNIDGDITSKVSVTGDVYTGTIGTSPIKYNVSDNAGNAADEVTRNVHVVQPDLAASQFIPYSTWIKNKPIEIKMKIADNNNHSISGLKASDFVFTSKIDINNPDENPEILNVIEAVPLESDPNYNYSIKVEPPSLPEDETMYYRWVNVKVANLDFPYHNINFYSPATVSGTITAGSDITAQIPAEGLKVQMIAMETTGSTPYYGDIVTIYPADKGEDKTYSITIPRFSNPMYKVYYKVLNDTKGDFYEYGFYSDNGTIRADILALGNTSLVYSQVTTPGINFNLLQQEKATISGKFQVYEDGSFDLDGPLKIQVIAALVSDPNKTYTSEILFINEDEFKPYLIEVPVPEFPIPYNIKYKILDGSDTKQYYFEEAYLKGTDSMSHESLSEGVPKSIDVTDSIVDNDINLYARRLPTFTTLVAKNYSDFTLLNWATDSPLPFYNLYKNNVLVKSGSFSEFTENVAPESITDYRLRGYDSLYSYPIKAYNKTLTAPSGNLISGYVSAPITASDAVVLKWEQFADANEYRIINIHTGLGLSIDSSLDTSSPTVMKTITGLNTNHNYHLRVEALNNSGHVIGAKTLTATTENITKIANFKVDSHASTSANVSWDSVSGASSYQITVYENGVAKPAINTGSLTNTTISSLDPGKVYILKLEALNSSNNVIANSIISAIAAKEISSFKAIDSSDSTIDLQWANIEAHEYQVTIYDIYSGVKSYKLDSSKTALTIEGLKQDAIPNYYKIRLDAIDISGDIIGTKTIQANTYATLNNFSVSTGDTPSTDIKVRWNHEKHAGEAPTLYSIKVFNSDTHELVMTDDITSGFPEIYYPITHNVTGLSPNKQYYVIVEAYYLEDTKTASRKSSNITTAN